MPVYGRDEEMNVIETLYYCRACHYIFPAATLPDRYPDCGKTVCGADPAVRPANETEMAEYRQIQRELSEENKISETP